MKLRFTASQILLYRGEYSGNTGGHYWTTDREWARQFTQSGLDSEIRTFSLDSKVIYRATPLPRATSEVDIDSALGAAISLGYKALWVSEGLNQPNSIYII